MAVIESIDIIKADVIVTLSPRLMTPERWQKLGLLCNAIEEQLERAGYYNIQVRPAAPIPGQYPNRRVNIEVSFSHIRELPSIENVSHMVVRAAERVRRINR